MLGWLVALAYSAEPGATPAPVPEPTGAPASGPVVQPGLMREGAPAPADPGTLSSASSASHRIDAAVSLYLAGDTSQARKILQAVLFDGDTLAPGDRQDALAWLGDILFAEQGPAAAQSVLASLLAENPDYPMDPLVHPPEFCDAFERMRGEVRSAPPPRPKHPYPWQVGIPFGVGYFIDGRPLPGVIFGTLQLGGLVTSIVTRVEMSEIVHDEIPRNDEEQGDHFVFLKTLNGVSASVGWAAWGIPLVVESARWSVSRRAPQVTTVELRPGGIAVSGRF